MTDEEIETIAERWKDNQKTWCESYCYSAIRHVDRNCEIECDHEGHYDDCPGHFGRYDGPMIAHAPSDVATLLAEVRRLRAS